MKQIPLLFLGDNPAIPGGLSRIGRDLALIASQMEEFRVGFLGRGGLVSSRLPFQQYSFPEQDQWGETHLQDVWNDFARGEFGVVMTIWDPSRLMWFANPIGMENEEWLRNPPFSRWGYFPVDATGPNNKLTITSAVTLSNYQRLLAYTIFGSEVITNSLGDGRSVPFLYHGIKMETFTPRDGVGVKMGMGFGKDEPLIGVVMTNQARKDWGLTFHIIAELKKQIKGLKVWCKTDSIDRYWDLRNLTVDFNVADVTYIDLSYKTDIEMSYMYSACDLTILPSLGEGFGYPIAESLACGTPVIHGKYAGGTELVPSNGWLVEPAGYRLDTRHNCVRPLYNVDDWTEAIGRAIGTKDVELCRESVSFLDWKVLKPQWQTWFREGVV